MLLQAITLTHANTHAEQHVLGGDATKETTGDAFRAEVTAQTGGPVAREPGTYIPILETLYGGCDADGHQEPTLSMPRSLSFASCTNRSSTDHESSKES